jgi:riboflavin kinase/FMN adenylyltransferase
MRIHRGLARGGDRPPLALAIGNFDGVHRGHQALLAQLVAAARDRVLVPAVLTFEPHPREFFAPDQAPARIANLRDKIDALSRCAVERVYVQHFNRRFAQLPAETFVETILVEGLGTRYLLVGDDFRFGARRAGDVALLRARATARYEVAQIETIRDDGERVSSSAVRAALGEGNLSRAAQLLGRNYAISGHVQHGRKLGRNIGFPTLNLRIAHQPPALHGIFAVRVAGIASRPLPGVASIGLRPTVEAAGRWLLEVHLFDFAADLYGRLVRVELLHKLRDEAPFANLDDLRRAIARDADAARRYLAAAR